MKVIRKDATISNTGPDDAHPGTFEVILSTAEEDRDGDELLPEDWDDLPEHITFDHDHTMSVLGTVGSGTPTLEDGQLIVRGTYSSRPLAQEVRGLVNERHIRTTSVAFMTKTITKGGKPKKVRELLNGAFVAVPSNRGAVVLDSKGAKTGGAAAASGEKAVAALQAISDVLLALGAPAATEEPSSKAVERRMVAAKAVEGSYEQRQQAISDAVDTEYRDTGGDRYVYAYTLATFDDSVVFRVGGGDAEQNGQWQADYTYNDDGTVTLGEARRVNMVEQVVPVKSYAPDENVTDEAPAAADEASAAAKAADAESAAADVDIQLKGRAIAARALALAEAAN